LLINDDDDDDSSLLLGLRLASIVSWLAITNTIIIHTDDDDEEGDDNTHEHDNNTNIYTPVLTLFNSCSDASASIKPLFVFQRSLLTVIATLVLEGRVKDTTTFIIALGYPIAFNNCGNTDTDDITSISMQLLTVVLGNYLSLLPRIIFTLCTNTATSTTSNKAKKRRITDDDESDDAFANDDHGNKTVPSLSDDQRLRLATAIVSIITNNDSDSDEQLQKIESALTSEVLSTGSKLSARALPLFELTEKSKATISASIRSGMSAKLISNDVQKLLQQRIK